MLYESTYNQYFLEHSWGPWKKHLYISRDGESGKFTYKYPKEYYQKYSGWKTKRQLEDLKKPMNERENMYYDAERSATKNADYYNEYYDTNFDKIINRSVKAAVSALNFGADLKQKAEGYLNRFANAVSDAWNSAKSPDRTRMQAGKQFVSNMWNYAKNTVTAKRISASVQNLVKGAGEAISKGWKSVKNSEVGDAARKVKRKVNNAGTKVRNTIKGAVARAQGATPV